MALPYNNNTPQGSQVIASTQAPILQNTQSIDAAFNGETGAGSGGGNFTTYSVQNTTASFVAKPINPLGILHSLADGANPELAWINNANAQGAGPFTGLQITKSGLVAANGEGFMPGGLQIRCGTKTGPGTNIVVAYTPFPTATLVAFAISNGNSRTWNTSALAPGNFTANASSALGAGDVFFYLAIGS